MALPLRLDERNLHHGAADKTRITTSHAVFFGFWKLTADFANSPVSQFEARKAGGKPVALSNMAST